MIKSVLALEHKTIPPNIKSRPLNPKIAFEKARLVVPEQALPWPCDRDERVSINSFGVGGANAHVILESGAQHVRSRAAGNISPSKSSKPHLLLYSANTAHSLQTMAQEYQSFLGRTRLDFADIAYTLANRRQHLPHRSFVVVSPETFDPDSAPPIQDASLGGRVKSLVMVFTGQGAAYPQLARDLLQGNPTFAGVINSLDASLQALGSVAPSWTIAEELRRPARTSRVYEAELAQPLCTAVQIALVDTRDCGYPT